MPVNISGSGSITGLSVGGLEDGIITPSELSTGGPSWDATGNVQVSGINSGPLAGFRNAIINGNFDIWQRGTSQTANGYGSADRWRPSSSGSTHEVTRVPFALGQTVVPGEPTYYWRQAFTSVAGANNYSRILHYIEGVRTFAGQTVTLSFWAFPDSSQNIAIEFEQYFGSGGSPSAPVSDISVTKKALTGGGWQKVTHTLTIPSIAGKTLGSDGNDSLTLLIWLDAGSTYNASTDSLGQQSGVFRIAQVQLEAGPVATPFERRPIGVELALCQRYYFTCSGDVGGAAGWKTANAARTLWFNSSVNFPVTMRIAPSVAWTSPTTNNATVDTHVVTPHGATTRAETTGATHYRIFGGTLTYDAEL